MASTLVGCSQPCTLTILSITGGSVSVIKAGTDDWIEAEVGMSLEVGDSIKTGDDSSAEITFVDGSTIELEAGTEFEVDSLATTDTGSATIVLKQTIGSIIFRVTKIVDPASRYEVETPTGVVAIRGSAMQVYVIEDGTTRATNLEGDIWAVAQGVELQVPEGRQCIIRPDESPELIAAVGGIFDLTGELATIGDLISKGATLAVEEVNADGGVLGAELELVIEDGASSADTGFTTYKKLVEVDGVQVIVGPMMSVAVMSSGAYAEDMKVPMVSPSATSALVHIQPWTDWAFRTCAADHAQATVVAQIITEEGYQTAATLAEDTVHGIGYESVVTEILEAADVEIVASTRYGPGKPDYIAELGAIKDANPDVIIQFGWDGHSAALIFEQAGNLGLDTIPWLVSDYVYGLDAETYPAAAAFMAEANLRGTTLAPDPELPAYAAFKTAYEARWGESPGLFCDTVYDAVNLIALAIEKAGEYDGAEIKEALYEVGVDYSGASGTITWDEKGDRVHGTYGIWKLQYNEETVKYEYVILSYVPF